MTITRIRQEDRLTKAFRNKCTSTYYCGSACSDGELEAVQRPDSELVDTVTIPPGGVVAGLSGSGMLDQHTIR